jgi:hypothetical protein
MASVGGDVAENQRDDFEVGTVNRRKILRPGVRGLETPDPAFPRPSGSPKAKLSLAHIP